MSYPTILEVTPGSPGAVAGLEIGDELLAINGVRPTDIIEYQQLVDEPDPVVLVRRAGLERELELDKSLGIPVGIRLNSSIFDRVQTCDNHCEFCFIYQLPPGMRKSLYLKDDDYRLSFLYGNFTTLTRFTELDLSRVVEERLGPLYVSIHATDPAVRSAMLRNKRGATSLRWLRGLLEHGVTVHGQVVLCPDINNADVLDRTCAEVLLHYPSLASVGIVPLGLSRYNTEKNLRVHTPAEAAADIEVLERWQRRALDVIGRRMFFASDEMYLAADTPIPASDAYEDYVQHENGIGMVRAFYDELERIEYGTGGEGPIITGEWRSIPAAPALGYRAPRSEHESPHVSREDGPVVLVTGEYGAKALAPVADRLEALAGRSIRIMPVRNTFFGGNVGVAGLIVGGDIIEAIAADTGDASMYLIPDVALQGDRFLDDVGLDQVSTATNVPVRAVPTTAQGLLEGIAA